MQITVTGLSHHTAPVSVRERFAFDQQELAPSLEHLSERFDAAAILSTCNRTEVYLAAKAAPQRQDVIDALSQVRAPIPEGVYFFHYAGLDAARHLFRVASSIDSLVIGES
jgi:glutamyl-tRNA reductase